MGMGKMLDLTGQRFGKLVAVRPVKRTGDEHVWWECRCDCGETCLRRADSLTSGKSKSRRLYYVWKNMRYRCERPSDRSYCSYGAKGITVCDEWKDYRRFEKWALDNGYDKNAKFGECTIDRIDPRIGYTPENCRFVDIQTQERTRGNNKRIVDSDGNRYLSLSELTRKLGVPRTRIDRDIRSGRPIDGVIYRYADLDFKPIED